MSEPMELAYEERGSGPVIIFIHGFPLDRRMWIGQLAGLAKNRRCVAVDLRGHGLSKIDDKEPAFSMDLFADDVAKTMDELGADQADICGLSMGGYVAFAFLRRHPARVRSLILADTKAEADSDEAKAGREKTAAMVREQGMEALWEGLGAKLLASNPKEEDVAQLEGDVPRARSGRDRRRRARDARPPGLDARTSPASPFRSYGFTAKRTS